MINPIQPNLFVARSTPPVFNEGAASTASKVVAFVAAAIAAIASFVFLPAEAALMVSAGTAALLSMLCCIPSDSVDRADEPQRWYHPVANAFRFFGRGDVVPVVQPGPRVLVGGNVQPYVAPVVVPHHPQVGHQDGPRAQVGHGHRPPAGGVAVMPQAWAHQPAAHPVVDRPPAAAVAGQHVPVRNARV
jgi:hypothetical protein